MGLNWIYKEKDFTEDMVGDLIGFVYIITNLSTGRKYIGKKFFQSSKTKVVKGKKKKTRVSSDWLTYWGSNKELIQDVKELGPEYFECLILRLCTTKKQLTYFEVHHQCISDCLLGANSYNDNILAKFFRRDFI